MRYVSCVPWLAFLISAPSFAQVAWRASVGPDGRQAYGHSRVDPGPVFTADGRYLVFTSEDAHLVAQDHNVSGDAFVRDLATGAIEVVGVTYSGGLPAGGTYEATISADGRFVAFTSTSPSLVFADTNNIKDVFLRDRILGTTERMSISTSGAETDDSSWHPRPSEDGRCVAFYSFARNLTAGDTNAESDVFVRDRLAVETQLISVAMTGGPGNRESRFPAISGTGRFVAFSSMASDLVPGDTNETVDVFVRDRRAGTTLLVSRSTAGVIGDGVSEQPSISADGRYVAFWSAAGNLVPDDTNGSLDVFVHDRVLGETRLVSRTPAGTVGGGGSRDAVISRDGQWVVYSSEAPDLDPADTNAHTDAFLLDLSTGLSRLISRDSAGLPFTYPSVPHWTVSDGGRRVAGWSSQPGWVPGDTNGVEDVFVWEIDTQARCSSYGSAKPNSAGCTPSIGINGLPSLSGSTVCDLSSTRLLNQQPGLYFWGLASAAVPFHGGTLLIAPPMRRSVVTNSGGSVSGSDCTGELLLRLDAAFLGAHGLAVGQTIHVQCWTRDPGFAPPDDVGLTAALALVIGA